MGKVIKLVVNEFRKNKYIAYILVAAIVTATLAMLNLEAPEPDREYNFSRKEEREAYTKKSYNVDKVLELTKLDKKYRGYVELFLEREDKIREEAAKKKTQGAEDNYIDMQMVIFANEIADKNMDVSVFAKFAPLISIKYARFGEKVEECKDLRFRNFFVKHLEQVVEIEEKYSGGTPKEEIEKQLAINKIDIEYYKEQNARLERAIAKEKAKPYRNVEKIAGLKKDIEELNKKLEKDPNVNVEKTLKEIERLEKLVIEEEKVIGPQESAISGMQEKIAANNIRVLETQKIDIPSNEEILERKIYLLEDRERKVKMACIQDKYRLQADIDSLDVKESYEVEFSKEAMQRAVQKEVDCLEYYVDGKVSKDVKDIYTYARSSRDNGFLEMESIDNAQRYTILALAILAIFVVVKIVSKEVRFGTLRLELVRPVSRTKYVFSKYITLLLVMAAIFAVAAITFTACVYAKGYNLQDVVIWYSTVTDGVVSLPLYAKIFTKYALYFASTLTIVTAVFSFAIATLNKYVTAVLGVILSLGQEIYRMFVEEGKMVIATFTPLLDITYLEYISPVGQEYVQGIWGFFGKVPGALLLNAILCIAMVCVATVIFKGKDIKNQN